MPKSLRTNPSSKTKTCSPPSITRPSRLSLHFDRGLKLLVDNQLLLALARFLAANRFDCQHVQDIGMGATDDQVIWEYAKSHDMTIVSKDEDFQLMADRQGSIPPHTFPSDWSLVDWNGSGKAIQHPG